MPEFTPDTLLGGDFPRQTATVTLAAGASLPRGAVLGRITASGKYKLCDKAADDGSQSPRALLAEAVAATSADASVSVYLTGAFTAAALTLGGTTTTGDVEDALRAFCIFVV
jgi:hypothetical protein